MGSQVKDWWAHDQEADKSPTDFGAQYFVARYSNRRLFYCRPTAGLIRGGRQGGLRSLSATCRPPVGHLGGNLPIPIHAHGETCARELDVGWHETQAASL